MSAVPCCQQQSADDAEDAGQKEGADGGSKGMRSHQTEADLRAHTIERALRVYLDFMSKVTVKAHYSKCVTKIASLAISHVSSE